MSYNTKGIGIRKKRCKVFHMCKKHNPDILLLQETHSRKKQEKVWHKDWGTKIYYSHGDYNARGVCICLKGGLNHKVHDCKIDENDIRYTIVNIYAPNEDDVGFFDEVFDMVGNFGNENVIIAGDFNFVLNSKIDKKGGLSKTHESCKHKLLEYMKNGDMVDVWRTEFPENFTYMWKSYSKPHIFCRLDFFPGFF